jgi:hypothetical protein
MNMHRVYTLHSCIVYNLFWLMKTSVKQHVNPINRDLAIILIMGMVMAIGLVTAGILLVNQL